MPAVPQGSLTLSLEEEGLRSLQLASPRALVAFLARCVVVNSVLSLSRDLLIQLSPKTTLSIVTAQIAPSFFSSA